ncbi:HDOD domain-containing protein [Dechloromonas sp. ZY10]|uniref:HDOD domain-containing protein n=1 Tax=Dechloromonas aquae TaxID=2664436 RepID=UPI003527E791
MSVTDCRHHKLLTRITSDLAGQANFPTCLDAAVAVRNTLQQEQVTLEMLREAVAGSPLIAARILRLANASAYNPGGKVIADLGSAISRIGFEAVRSISLAIAIAQMNAPQQPPHFAAIAAATLEHSLQVAAIARTLARTLGRINPDEAMLAGLVHDIGIFYLLYHAAEASDYRQDSALLDDLLACHHEAIGEQLLLALALPGRIIRAVSEHEHLQHVETPSSIRDVLYFANLLATPVASEISLDLPAAERELRQLDRERYQAILSHAEDHIADLRTALAAA